MQWVLMCAKKKQNFAFSLGDVNDRHIRNTEDAVIVYEWPKGQTIPSKKRDILIPKPAGLLYLRCRKFQVRLISEENESDIWDRDLDRSGATVDEQSSVMLPSVSWKKVWSEMSSICSPSDRRRRRVGLKDHRLVMIQSKPGRESIKPYR